MTVEQFERTPAGRLDLPEDATSALMDLKEEVRRSLPGTTLAIAEVVDKVTSRKALDITILSPRLSISEDEGDALDRLDDLHASLSDLLPAMDTDLRMVHHLDLSPQGIQKVLEEKVGASGTHAVRLV